jgi:hypothetical protein
LDENYIKNLNEYTEKRLRMSNSIIVYNLLDSVNKEEVYRKWKRRKRRKKLF